MIEDVPNGTSSKLQKLRFRNYNPRSEELKKYVVEVPPVDAELQRIDAEQRAAMQASNAKFADPALDLENMVPKKPNWDLKRALMPKVELLKRQTTQALLEIAQEKAKASGSGEGLVATGRNAEVLSSDEEGDEDNTL